ncbi:hypothetical protein GJ700_05200 [Duganella sp. FT92W]|uniref:Uncharacterized protein n=1 Tax=Pseudoduganella rivuli TaxID=2666085 RepID=A0A7X2LST7_9BURK|nr:hypothetical protein [Pseudoduganella rivuli]MRV71114.1 hypothetical protein [Pseudoduganella rivuli]
MTVITIHLNILRKIANISLIIKTAGHYLGRLRSLQGFHPEGGYSPQILRKPALFNGRSTNFSSTWSDQTALQDHPKHFGKQM